MQHKWLQQLNVDYALTDTLLEPAVQLVMQHANQDSHSSDGVNFCLAVADELIALDCHHSIVTAGMLYPLYLADKLDEPSILAASNHHIVRLLQGAKRMQVIDSIALSTSASQAQSQLSNLRKMLLAAVDDVSVILLRLAERLVNLRYAKLVDTNTQQQLANQAMQLYAPLANRLGIGQLKWQLEDFAFRYLDTEQYFIISKALNMRRTEREQLLEVTQHALITLLEKTNITDYQINGRVKHIYGIYRKAQQKSRTLKRIYDALALRILVPDIPACYEILGHIHSHWQPITSEFDDYIAHPKPNGYQSLHTVIRDNENHDIEIQIRTHQMHREAELGIAAHWKYKENNTKANDYAEKINVLREIMDWQRDISHQDDQTRHLYNQIFNDRIYVFTPSGDIIDLPQGATPLDFAYRIHTDLGHRCRGAKINGKIVPLTHQLATSDCVDILSHKNGQPSRDWLSKQVGYVKTTHAIQKIRTWFHKQEQQEYRQKGQELWEKACHRHGITNTTLKDIYALLKFNSVDELLVQIGNGKVGLNTLINRLQQNTTLKTDALNTLENTTIDKVTSQDKQKITEVDNLLTQLARCCQPIPGDDITGYITKGHGITIHRSNCRNLRYAKKRNPERIIVLDWAQLNKNHFPIRLQINANDYLGLVRDVTTQLANHHINVLKLTTHVNAINNQSQLHATIEVNQLSDLQKIITLLKQLPNITSVTRE